MDSLVASIVICTYNRAEMLSGALTSVLAQKMPPGNEFEVVVVDDGSTDETAVVVARTARNATIRVRYVPVPHRGIAAARNAGVAAALGEWVAFLDDDEIASPTWLSKLLTAAASENADCVSGRNELSAVEPIPFRLVDTVRKLLGDNGFMSKPGAVVNPGGGNALVRRTLFSRIGGFDPTLSYGEDSEFFRRARWCGTRIVFADDARILHLIPKHRLAAAHLLTLAKQGAARQAFEDLRDGGAKALIRNCALRSFHLPLVLVPRLVRGWLTGDRGQLMGARCSARFSLAYCVTAARLLTSART